VIGSVQTFGDLIHWHPHIHAIVADGVFTETGHFVRIPDTWKHRAMISGGTGGLICYWMRKRSTLIRFQVYEGVEKLRV